MRKEKKKCDFSLATMSAIAKFRSRKCWREKDEMNCWSMKNSPRCWHEGTVDISKSFPFLFSLAPLKMYRRSQISHSHGCIHKLKVRTKRKCFKKFCGNSQKLRILTFMKVPNLW